MIISNSEGPHKRSVRPSILVFDVNETLLDLGGRIEGPELAWDLIQTFLAANFSHAPRHGQRLAKVAALEEPPPAKA